MTMKKSQKQNKGITLVALVITIIVLIILAAVSINAVMNDGLIKYAKDAKDKYDASIQKENTQLSQLEEEIDYINSIKWTGKIANKIEQGEGTEQNPYIVKKPEELAFVAKSVREGTNLFIDKYFVLETSFNLGGIENGDGTWSGLQWTPIGCEDAEAGTLHETKSFQGHFDGQGNTIYNMNVNIIETDGTGLFGVLYGGSIKNLNIKNSNVVGNYETGAIVGYVVDGEIENCTNAANVTAGAIGAGGIVGALYGGTVTNCTNTGDITAVKQQAGGIIGGMTASAEVATIANCTNSGKITVTSGNIAGGIIGNMKKATVQNCSNIEEIVVYGQIAGGIIGKVSNGEILGCKNNADITAKDTDVADSGCWAGGISGYFNGGTIRSCVNNGKIVADDSLAKVSRGKFAGGISGGIYAGSIYECNNNGEVIVEYQNAGGIAGVATNQITIEKCNNTGKIIAKYNKEIASTGAGANAGGIVGWRNTTGGTISQCSNSGEIIAENISAGGIVAQSDCGLIELCSNSGYILSNSDTSSTLQGVSGGIVAILASNENSSIEECYNSGKVEAIQSDIGVDLAGGIVGDNRSIIKYCYNNGEISGEQIGGISGKNSTANTVNIEKCYYYSETLNIGIGGTERDTLGLTDKTTDIIRSFEEFKTWIANKK